MLVRFWSPNYWNETMKSMFLIFYGLAIICRPPQKSSKRKSSMLPKPKSRDTIK